MKKRNKFLVLSLILILILALAGCKSDDPKDENQGNESKEPGTSDQGTDETPTPIGEQKISLGDLDSESLTVFPKEKTPSMYYYDTQELINEVFMPEQDDKLGVPYAFNGTVMEEYDSILDYLSLNEKHGPDLVGLDATAKAYKIMTERGPVIVMDVLPHQIKYVREYGQSVAKQYLNGNLTIFDYYDSWFNELKSYTNFPETGGTYRFYGFYFGYDEASKCPVFTYGVSELARSWFFDYDYLKYRNDKVKKYKYYNNFTIEYPVGWSTALKKSGRVQIYMPDSAGGISIQDFDSNEMSLDDLVSMYIGESPAPGSEDMPEGGGPAMNDNIRIKSKEKTFIGDGSVSTYHIVLEFKSNGNWMDIELYAFQSKNSFIILEIDRTPVQLNATLNPEETEAAEQKIEQFNAVIDEEIANMLKSIVLITTY